MYNRIKIFYRIFISDKGSHESIIANLCICHFYPYYRIGSFNKRYQEFEEKVKKILGEVIFRSRMSWAFSGYFHPLFLFFLLILLSNSLEKEK